MDDQLSDLEGGALAFIARNGPTTSYAVAKDFADSPSEFWSGSAGAVYPLIKRVLARGLLEASKGKDGARARTRYTLTPAGLKAMKAWLLNAKRASSIGFDPLRTRIVHLDQVSAEERKEFLKQVQALLDAAKSETVWNDIPRLAAIHATVLEARQSWLNALKALFD